MENKLKLFFASNEAILGFAGPSGLGKSYSLLFNYLDLRKTKRIIYINELIFCFAPELKSVLLFNSFKESDFLGCDSRSSIDYLKALICGSSVEESDVPKLLWAFFITTYETGYVDVDTIVGVLQMLRKYCFKRYEFVLFFDQLNVLLKKTSLPNSVQDKWYDIFFNQGCFNKLLRVSSQNNDFTSSSSPLKFMQTIKFLKMFEIDLLLDSHISFIDDPEVRSKWEENFSENVDFIFEKTSGNAYEVPALLKTSGLYLLEKWEKYRHDRFEQILPRHFRFLRAPDFNKELFMAFLLIADRNDLTVQQMDLSVRATIYDKHNIIWPGSLDWNILYYYRKTDTVHSLSPIAKAVANYIKDNNLSEDILSQAFRVLKGTNITNPMVKGCHYENEIINTFMTGTRIIAANYFSMNWINRLS